MSFMGNMIGNKALAAHGKNEYEKAMQLYDEAYEKGMDKPRLLRGYSVLLIRMGRLDRALEVLKKIEALPGLTPAEKTDLHVNYAIILSQKGHLDRAMDILEDEFRHLKNGTMYSIIGYLRWNREMRRRRSPLTGRRWITTTQTRYFWITWGRPTTALSATRKPPRRILTRPSRSNQRRLIRITFFRCMTSRRATGKKLSSGFKRRAAVSSLR